MVFGGPFYGTANGTVGFAGLTPTAVGLYQINVTLPADTPSGNVPLFVTVGSANSQTVTVAVQ